MTMSSSSSSSRSNSPSPPASDGGSLLPLHPESVEALRTPSSLDNDKDDESVFGGDGGGEDSEAAADLAVLALPPPVTLTSVCHPGSNYEERVGFVLSVDYPYRKGQSGGSEIVASPADFAEEEEGDPGRVGAAPRSSSPSRRSALMGYSALRPPRTSRRNSADVAAPEAGGGRGNKGRLLVRSLLRRKGVLPLRRGGGHSQGGRQRRRGRDGEASRRRSHVGLEVVCGADGDGPEVSQLSLFKSNGDEKDEDLRRRPSGETGEA